MTPGHPWGHGAQSIRGAVARGELLDCGHKTRRKDSTAALYDDGWVCDDCNLARCPVCGPAGRNVCLDGTEADQRGSLAGQLQLV